MNDVDTPKRETAACYLCSACSRRFIDLGATESSELACSCGAPLTPHPAPRGLHELGGAVAEARRVTTPGRTATPKEPDQGYGASHGYDVTHGGPSGPGDAPADVPEETS